MEIPRMKYIVYLLERSDGQKYVGSTNSKRYKRRMNEHKVHDRFKGYTFTDTILYESTSHIDCLENEERLIKEEDTYKNGLNKTKDGTGKNLSKNFTHLGS